MNYNDVTALLQSAKDAAERMIGQQIADVSGLTTLLERLQTVADVEHELVALAQGIVILDRTGWATAWDFNSYNTIRLNLATVQRRLLDACRMLYSNRPDVLRMLPSRAISAPALVPQFSGVFAGPATATLATTLSASGSAGTSGLGNLAGPEAAPAVAGALAPWMVCAIILAAIIGLGVAAFAAASTLGLIAEAVRDILVTRAQLRGLAMVVQTRRDIYDGCIAQGRTPDQCSQTAINTVPTMAENSPRIDPIGQWQKWVTLGILGVGLLGAGLYAAYYFSKKRGHGEMMLTELSGVERPRFRPIRADRFASESADDGGLPV
jgi:hypothetical protein